MRTAKIIVCCHKQDVMAKDAPYMPIQVGKTLSQVDLSIQSDNEGENISYKNHSYCELTGLYWAWKNLKNVDVIGLVHYRRYFDFHHQCDSVLPETPFATADFAKVDLSIPRNIIESLQDGEAYVAKPRYYRHSLYIDYCCAHISDDIRQLEQYILETQSEDIIHSWYDVMHRDYRLLHYNMFIMNWHNFDEYCSWLFPILLEMEKRIDISHYDSVQGRIWGYMGERLLNVWLVARKFNLHKQPLIWFNDYYGGSSRSHLTYYRNNLRSWLALAITRGNYKNWRK